MAFYPYDRFLRAGSAIPGGYDFLGKQMSRARSIRASSALPESMYEDAYNSSLSSRLSRAMTSSSSFVRSGTVDIPAPAQIIPYTITTIREKPRRSYLSNYLDYFRSSDALVHARITIRKRDNYWHDKYIRDIVNARPNVTVVRPRYIVQRPIHVYRAPTPPPQPIIVPRYIYVKPRTVETVRTVSRLTRYTPPAPTLYLTHRTIDADSSNYVSSSSSSSSSANYLRNYSSANNYLTY